MIHTETHLVTKENGPRPAGRPDECFFCHRKLGSKHREDCVLRESTVIVRATFEMLIPVPEYFTKEQITASRNGSWCGSTTLDELVLARELKKDCLCDVTKVEYLREATKEDDIEWGRETL